VTTTILPNAKWPTENTKEVKIIVGSIDIHLLNCFWKKPRHAISSPNAKMPSCRISTNNLSNESITSVLVEMCSKNSGKISIAKAKQTMFIINGNAMKNHTALFFRCIPIDFTFRPVLEVIFFSKTLLLIMKSFYSEKTEEALIFI